MRPHFTEAQFASAIVAARRQNAEVSETQETYIDLLRAIAAQLVVLEHACQCFLRNSPLAAVPLGSIGVVIFFLISGFLISYTVLVRSASGNYTFVRFSVDRFFRIFTAYVPALLIVAAVDTYFCRFPGYQFNTDLTLHTWLGNLFMLQDYPLFQIARRVGVDDRWWFIGPFGSGRPFWTVSIEWWIYMLFGWITLVWLRGTRQLTIRTSILPAIFMIVPGYHLIGGFGECLTALWLVGMGFSICFVHGGTTGWSNVDKYKRSILVLIGIFGLLLIGRLVATNFRIYDLQTGFFLGSVLFLILFLCGAKGIGVPSRAARCAKFAAGYSYSLYLVHNTFVVVVSLMYPNMSHNGTIFSVAVLGSNVVAIVFWWLFERHYKTLSCWVRGVLNRMRQWSFVVGWKPKRLAEQ